MAIYKNTPPIVTNGLVNYFDIANLNSYESRNLLLDTTNLTTGWGQVPFFAVIQKTSSAAIAPDGTMTAVEFFKESGTGWRAVLSLFSQNVLINPGDTTTFSVYAKAKSGSTSITLDIGDEGNITWPITDSTWTRCYTTVTYIGQYASTTNFCDIALPLTTSVYLAAPQWNFGELIDFIPSPTTPPPVKNLPNPAISSSLINGPYYKPYRRGLLRFDGIDDRLQFSTTYTISNSSDWTIQTWIRSNQTSSNSPYIQLLGLNTTGGSNYFTFEWNDRILAMNAAGGTFAFQTGFTPSLPLNQSNFLLTLVGRNSNLELYYNSLKTTVNTPLSGSLQFNNLMISNGNYSPGGDLHAFSLYNRALSQAEITQNYNAYKTRFNLS